MQNRRSNLAPTLPGRISFHRYLRAVRLRGGLRKTASIRTFENSKCFWSGCQSIGRPERKFWHHDQAVSGRSRRGERSGIGGSCRAWLDGGGANFVSGKRGFLCLLGVG